MSVLPTADQLAAAARQAREIDIPDLATARRRLELVARVVAAGEQALAYLAVAGVQVLARELDEDGAAKLVGVVVERIREKLEASASEGAKP